MDTNVWTIRSFDFSKDYGHMLLWLKKRKRPPINPDLLPKNGVTVLINSKPICCGFLFMTDAKLAIIGNSVSDPDQDKETVSLAVDKLLDALIAKAKEMGFLFISTASNRDRLVKRYEERQFLRYDENMTHLGRFL